MSINPTAGPSTSTGAGSKSDSSFEDILSGAEQKKKSSQKSKLKKPTSPKKATNAPGGESVSSPTKNNVNRLNNGAKPVHPPSPPSPQPNFSNGNTIFFLEKNGFSMRGTEKNDNIQANDRTTYIDGGKGKDLVELPDNAQHVRLEKKKGNKVVVAYNTTGNRSDNSSRVILTLKNVEFISTREGAIDTKNLKTGKKQNIEDVKGFANQKEFGGAFR